MLKTFIEHPGLLFDVRVPVMIVLKSDHDDWFGVPCRNLAFKLYPAVVHDFDLKQPMLFGLIGIKLCDHSVKSVFRC